MAEFPVTATLQKAMGKSLKKFFFAYVERTVLHLDGAAPWEHW